jgi:glycosyltransferase involved in cell wall biosynthesis
LIIVDDQSPHAGVPTQIASYQDPRIRYERNEKNLGQSGNWNRCLELTKTDYVTLLHADDMLQPHYAETMVEAFKRYPDAAAITCRSHFINQHGKRIFTIPDLYKSLLLPSFFSPFFLTGEEGLLSLIRGNFVVCPTLCYCKPKLKDLQFLPDFKCAPDLDFMSRMLVAGLQIVGIPEPAFWYRRHEESGTATFRKNLQQFEEEIKLLDVIAERAATVGWKEASRAARRKTVVSLRLGFFGLKDLLSLRLEASKAKMALASRSLFGTRA